MTDIDLDALEVLAEAATPGPWQFLKDYAAIYGPEPIEEVKAAARACNEVAGPVVIAIMEDNGPLAEVDAAFIAAARTAVPLLVARVRELEARVGNLHQMVGDEATVAGAKVDAIVDEATDQYMRERAWGIERQAEAADLRARLNYKWEDF